MRKTFGLLAVFLLVFAAARFPLIAAEASPCWLAFVHEELRCEDEKNDTAAAYMSEARAWANALHSQEEYEEMPEIFPDVAVMASPMYRYEPWGAKLLERSVRRIQGYVNVPFYEKDAIDEASLDALLYLLPYYENEPYAEELFIRITERIPENSDSWYLLLRRFFAYGMRAPFAESFIKKLLDGKKHDPYIQAYVLQYFRAYEQYAWGKKLKLDIIASLAAGEMSYLLLKQPGAFKGEPRAKASLRMAVERAIEENRGIYDDMRVTLLLLTEMGDAALACRAGEAVLSDAEKTPFAGQLANFLTASASSPFLANLPCTAAQKERGLALYLENSSGWYTADIAPFLIQEIKNRPRAFILNYPEIILGILKESTAQNRTSIESSGAFFRRLSFSDEYAKESAARASRKTIGEKLREHSGDPAIKSVFTLARFYQKYQKTEDTVEEKLRRYETRKRLPALLERIAQEGLPIESYLPIIENDERFFVALVDILKRAEHPLGEKSVDTYIAKSAQRIVREINNLHNEPDGVRFRAVEGMEAVRLYLLMAYAEEEIYTSSFNGLLDRLLARLESERRSGADMLQSVHSRRLHSFIRELASFGRLRDFLATMPAGEQRALLARFVRSPGDAHGAAMRRQAVAVADVFVTVSDAETLAMFQEEVRAAYERAQKEKDADAAALYGILAGLFEGRAVVNEAWIERMAARYKLKNLAEIDTATLFDKDGVHRQLHLFYDDEDGRASFAHFLAQYRGDENWEIKDRRRYVVVSSVAGKTIEIYANKPAAEGGVAREEISTLFSKNDWRIPVLVHRGHSYHVNGSLPYLQEETQVVFLGSCGSYTVISDVLGRTKGAHILSTKGTGTMRVNDPLLKLMNEYIREGRALSWPVLWRDAGERLGDIADFGAYVPPHLNVGVLFLKVYNQETERSGDGALASTERLVPTEWFMSPFPF